MLRKLAFLSTLLFSLAASAGPSIVESGGYTFLPGAFVTSKGLYATGNLTTSPPTLSLGFAAGSHSNVAVLWLSTSQITPNLANYSLANDGATTIMNAPSSQGLAFRINNGNIFNVAAGTTVLTFSGAASGSNAIFFATNGQRLDLGSGSNDYFSSDATTISTPGAFAAGSALSANADAVTIPKGTRIQLDAADDANNNTIRASSNGIIQFGTGATEIVASDFQGNLRGGGTNTLIADSFVNDGASAVAFTFRTQTALTTAGSKIMRWMNNTSSTERASIDMNGSFWMNKASLRTCASGIEGMIAIDTLAGGTSTSKRTKLCLCTSDGAASPAFVWQNAVTGTLGTATTCGTE